MSESIRKTRARVAERERRRKQKEQKNNLLKTVPLVLMAMVAIAGLGFFVYTQTVKPARPANAGIIGPRLQVDREQMDLGNRPLNVAVRAEFKVQNVGDDTLNLDVPKYVNALEGC